MTTTTFAATSGPALRTVIVYVTSLPNFTGSGASVIVTAISAERAVPARIPSVAISGEGVPVAPPEASSANRDTAARAPASGVACRPLRRFPIALLPRSSYIPSLSSPPGAKPCVPGEHCLRASGGRQGDLARVRLVSTKPLLAASRVVLLGAGAAGPSCRPRESASTSQFSRVAFEFPAMPAAICRWPDVQNACAIAHTAKAANSSPRRRLMARSRLPRASLKWKDGGKER